MGVIAINHFIVVMVASNYKLDGHYEMLTFCRISSNRLFNSLFSCSNNALASSDRATNQLQL